MDRIKDDFYSLLRTAKEHDATIYEFLSHYTPERWLSYDHVHNLYDKIKEEAINRSVFVKFSYGSSLDVKQGLISRKIYEYGCSFEIVETEKGTTHIAKDPSADFLKIELFSSQTGLREVVVISPKGKNTPQSDGEEFSREFQSDRLTISWADEEIVYEPERTMIRRIGESFIEISGASMRFHAAVDGGLYSADMAFKNVSFSKNVSVFFIKLNSSRLIVFYHASRLRRAAEMGKNS